MMVDDRLYIYEGGSIHYLVMAKFLAVEHSYWELNYPTPRPEVKTPLGFSLMIAPLYLVFGYNILMIKIMIFSFLILGTIFGYLFFQRLSNDWKISLIILLAGYLAPVSYNLNLKITPEIPFLALTYISLYLLFKSEDSKFSLFKAFIIGAIIGFNCLIRSAGMPLILSITAFIFYKLFIRKSRAFLAHYLLILLTAGFFISPWIIWSNRVSNRVKGEGLFTYLDIVFCRGDYPSLELGLLDFRPPLWSGPEKINFPEFAQRLYRNTVFYIKGFAEPTGNKIYSKILFYLLPFAFLGAFIKMSRNLILNLYGILYLVLIISYPYPDQRFLSPIYSIILFWSIEGLSFLKDRYIQGRRYFYFLYGLGIILIIASIAQSIYTDYNIWHSVKRASHFRTYQVNEHFTIVPLTQARANYVSLLKYINESTNKDEIFATLCTHCVYLVTGRKAVQFPITKDSKQFWEYFRINNVRYIIIDEIYKDIEIGYPSIMPLYAIPQLEHCPYELKKEYQIPFSQTMLLSISGYGEN